MIEKEVKILDINKEKIIERIKELNGKKVFDDMMEAYYFESENLDKKKFVLRIRKEGPKSVLCLKEKISKEKIKEYNEYETEISNLDNMVKILENLGYHKSYEHIKHRTSFVLSDAKIEIDEFKNFNIPTFLEIEAESYNKILEIAKLLGFSEKDLKAWSSKDLFEHYGIEK